MIYDQADMVARRLLGQKIGERVYYETADTAEDIRRFINNQGRVVVTAPRQSGKTTELLIFAEQKDPWGQFIVVCLNQAMQTNIIQKHKEIFTAGNVAKRLTGGKVESTEVSPPLIITPTRMNLLRGMGRPIYVDEFRMFTDEMQKEILDSKFFVAAVTS